jgi:uncharacterized membrane protein
MREQTASVAAGATRISGIDVARALAIVGMVMVHVGPQDAGKPGIAAQAYRLSHGRASILFVVLAGIGVSLLAGDRSPPDDYVPAGRAPAARDRMR